MAREIYMDYAATTYTKPEVLEEMIPYFTKFFGNPSSIYTLSGETKKAVKLSRERVANAIGAEPGEIYFTGGGSEADNWALKGVASANRHKGNHIITTKIEHHAILNACKFLKKQGYEITYLPVDKYGFISVEELKAAITDKTILVSVMFANNEIGTIQPIKEIGSVCKEKGVLFHTDAVQAVGNINIDVKELNIDLLSLAGHKFYGPKGTGALYIRKGIRIDNLVHGGGQEKSKMAGTENVAGIVGLGKAIELAVSKIDENSARLTSLRNKLIAELTKIPYSRLNGPDGEQRLAGNVNIAFEFVEGESILLLLNDLSIGAVRVSACNLSSLEPSHVLLAIGLPHEKAHGSLRLSMGEGTTEEEVDYVIKSVHEVINKLRNMSPLWDSLKIS